MNKNLLLLTLFFISIILAGCGGGLQAINVNLKTDSDCNDNNAIVIKIYQLKNSDKFTHASFESLLRDPEGTLTDDLIPNSKSEVTMVPSEIHEIKDLKIIQGAQFIGIIGNFHSPAQDGWRQIIPVSSDIKNLKVSIHQNYLSVQK